MSGTTTPKRPQWQRVYEIKGAKSNTVQLRRMEWHYAPQTGMWHEMLQSADQQFANELLQIVQKACAYFYQDDDEYEPMEIVQGFVPSDDEVRERIQRGHTGELRREAQRTRLKQYDIPSLPWDQQQALISHINKLRVEWSYRKIGIYIPEELEDVTLAAIAP
jgi:hypothetical protein|tara:strand:- start:24 stop:512 length:489 start_codon:yes stop_codon:yes gene_type:complete